MIWLDCPQEPSLKTCDAVVLLAQQLARLGHDPVIDERMLPEEADAPRRYEAAPFLADLGSLEPERLILLGVDDLALSALDRLRFGPTPIPERVDALGRFPSRQSQIDAETRLSYALSRDVRAINLDLLQETPLIDGAASPVFGETLPPRRDQRPVVQVYLEAEEIDEPTVIAFLEALSFSDTFTLEVIVAGAGKSAIGRSRALGVSVYGYSELPPFELSARADVLVFRGTTVPGERMAQHLANMLINGRPVIDCTEARAIAGNGLPVLAGPGELAALQSYLEKTVIPNLSEIRDTLQRSPWVAKNAFPTLGATLGLDAVRTSSEEQPEIVFMPTNGNGLGHARRTLLIAEKLSTQPARFAAFPSCVPMINRAGFACDPLVSRSTEHVHPSANDILNYLRLRRIVGPRDTFVFDGGYVFDSVMRTLAETRAAGVWIRRGLWRSGQKRSATLEREKIFDRVIVPEEAFDELNEPLSFGGHIRTVGPVVATDEGDPGAVRSDLSHRFDRPFDHLVVSMLGGGEASDRTANTMHLAALAERREGLLHLVVAWPGAVVAPGLFGWSNTRIVQTQNALALARAADFVVSAVGYNGFHECLFHAIPAIFVPQIAPFMDDQERRARAAVERGLADIAMPGEMALIERQFDAMLEGRADHLRSALQAADLRERGNAAAARLIEEVADARK